MAEGGLVVETRQDGVIAVSGELDSATAGTLDDALVAVRPPIRVDLAELTFIDSAGLHALLRLHQRPGTVLTVVDASPNVRRLFELAGVAALLGPEATTPAHGALGCRDRPGDRRSI
jgi:anti-anti-sigma factor